MDTKSRSIKYSFALKAVAVFLLWVSFTGMLASAAFYGMNYDEINRKNYYENYKFADEFRYYIDNVIKSAEVQKLVEKAIKPDFTNYKVTGYNISSAVNFRYLIISTKTGDIVTNMEIKDRAVQQAAAEFSKMKTFFFYSEVDKKYSSQNMDLGYQDDRMYTNMLGDLIKHAPLEIYAAVDDQLIPGDIFYEIQNKHINVHNLIQMFIIIVIAALVVGLCSFIYLIVVVGQNNKSGEIKPAMVDWFYNDLHAAVVLTAAVLSFGLGNALEYTFHDDVSRGISIFVLLSIDFFIGLSYILSMIRHIKRKTLFKHTLIYSLFRVAIKVLHQCFAAKAFKPAIIVMLLAYGGVNAILFAIGTHLDSGGFPFMMIVLLMFNVGAIYYISKALTSLSGIMMWVREMTKGNLKYSLDTVNISPAFTAFINDIGNLQAGIRHAVAEAIKGERLKTELITNVSHDLKTPLTSIINYVDLLKKENLENETVNEYISVLEDKSARLKQLIEDLMQASKAASGDIAVNFGSVDLCALAQQSTAEYNEKAAEAGLDVRIKVCESPAVVHGDGSLMWRIMDNLLSNVIKYSQKNSRVYIDIEDTGTFGVITIKNISESPLDVPADQLLERFVRGDSSRTTEGSGLGLSIAQSLAQLQGGTLSLKTDGDLFKVIVSMPLEVPGK